MNSFPTDCGMPSVELPPAAAAMARAWRAVLEGTKVSSATAATVTGELRVGRLLLLLLQVGVPWLATALWWGCCDRRFLLGRSLPSWLAIHARAVERGLSALIEIAATPIRSHVITAAHERISAAHWPLLLITAILRRTATLLTTPARLLRHLLRLSRLLLRLLWRPTLAGSFLILRRLRKPIPIIKDVLTRSAEFLKRFVRWSPVTSLRLS